MMDDCQRIAARLASYVDAQLPAGERADVERHLGACPPCRMAEQRERGARDVLRDKASELSAVALPPGLRSRCEALAREHTTTSELARRSRSAYADRPNSTAWVGSRRDPTGEGGPTAFISRFAPLTAVMTLVIGFFLFSLATHRFDTVLAAQLTADHAKCFRFFASSDSGADARRVEQMLEDDYGWDLHVPPSSAASGIRLLGARRCLYADGSLPHVLYDAGGHDVSLYVLDDVARQAADLVSLGHRARIWSSGIRTYVLVWPVAAADIGPALRYVMAEAR